jgi:hypothetical protein
MSAGYARARGSAAASGDTMFSGAFEFLLTTAASWALMPLLLWAGMRVTGETGNAVLVPIGGLVWAGVSGYFSSTTSTARAGTCRSLPWPRTFFSVRGWQGSARTAAAEVCPSRMACGPGPADGSRYELVSGVPRGHPGGVAVLVLDGDL